jgi:hypothetical protein
VTVLEANSEHAGLVGPIKPQHCQSISAGFVGKCCIELADVEDKVFINVSELP